ncbi:unnamed protein product, partial [Notodromas monacha]
TGVCGPSRQGKSGTGSESGSSGTRDARARTRGSRRKTVGGSKPATNPEGTRTGRRRTGCTKKPLDVSKATKPTKTTTMIPRK